MIKRMARSLNERLLAPADLKVVRRSALVIPAERRIANRNILFFHPPKCGGTSVSKALSRCFGQDRLECAGKTFHLDAIASRRAAEAIGTPLPAYREMLLSYALGMDGIQYISGHFPFSNRLLQGHDAQWDFITVLRHPFERLLSTYYYNRHKPNREHFPIEQPLEEWLQTDNARQSATLFLRLFNGELARRAEPSREGHPSPATEQAVQEAIANLRRFTLVGETADMAGFIGRINEEFEINLQPRHERRSPAPDYQRFEEQPLAIQRQIAELCAPDLAIYEAFFENRHRAC